MNTGWFFQQSNRRLFPAKIQRVAGSIAVAALVGVTSIAVAQNPTGLLSTPDTQITAPAGYTGHHTVDLGGRMVNTVGSGAMYDTLVNVQSGPRVLGETFTMHALPGKKGGLVDSLTAIGNGFGGDPNNSTKLDFSKGKIYEFSGMFRRDRQYFDYDLLGNPNIPAGQNIAIGPVKSPTGSFTWPQVNQSPVLFNTVRRMTDTHLTILPLSKVTYRVGYSQNIFQGPTLSPGGYTTAVSALLQEMQRNSTDEFLAAVDWKPVQGTMITFEEEINHYKADSYFTLAPSSFNAQEANGTPVALGSWDTLTPYGISSCNTASMGSAYTNSTTYQIFTAPQNGSGLPVVNAACAAITSYIRSQPTRIITPTSTLRLQSSSIKNLSMNGDFRYTLANMNLPNYYENAQGLSGVIRSITYTGTASAHRAVVAADYGVIWQATKSISIADQVSYSSVQQPGNADAPLGVTLSTPASATGNATINYSGPLTTGTFTGRHDMGGTAFANYYGQESLVNNLTASWDPTSRVTLSLTYRYSNRNIGQGDPHKGSIPYPLADPVNGTVAISENGGIFNAAFHPTHNWDINGTVEILYADNVFTPVAPRQTQHYRLHTMFKPKSWATVSGAFNDQERHNNTYNNQDTVAAGEATYYGPIDHVDHSRSASLGAVLTPNEHYGLDLNYGYSDVYTATNICFTSGAAAGLPGAATLTSSGAPNICPGIYARGTTTPVDFFARDFMDAPTQYGSVAVTLSPVDKIHSGIGYRISSVNGSQFFSDARAVNGSLNSTYQSPFVNIAWTMHPGLIWKAEYNFYGYGEGGPSGAEYCSTTVSTTAVITPCASSPYQTGRTESPAGLTAPRNFHANNVTLGVHYEF
jgi:hypothetical protein